MIAEAHAHYLGAILEERSLVAGDEAELGGIRFDDWLRETAPNLPGRNVVPAGRPPSPGTSSVSATCLRDRCC